MTTDHFLALLISERDKLTTAIEALEGLNNRENTGSRSKGGTAVCRTGLGSASDGRSHCTGETKDERCGQTGDYRGDKEALGGDQGGEGCCCGARASCGGGGDTQGSASQGSGGRELLTA